MCGSMPTPLDGYRSIGLVLVVSREKTGVVGRLRLQGEGAWRSDEVGPQRFADDVGLVDTVTIGALLEQISEVIIQPRVDRG